MFHLFLRNFFKDSCRPQYFLLKYKSTICDNNNKTSEQKSNQTKNLNKLAIVKNIKFTLHCEQKKANEIYEEIESKFKCDAPTINRRFTVLTNFGITNDSILQNPWLLCIPDIDLKIKLLFLQEMKPRNINDFVPLLILDSKNLANMQFHSKKEIGQLPAGYEHRIYYFSEKLHTTPEIIAKRFADNIFMLNNSFEYLNKNLQIFSEYGIKPQNILQDIGIFRHSHETVLSRLERVKSAGIDNIMPWMIKCLDHCLESMIQSRIDERAALGKHKNIESFLAESLNLNKTEVKHILEKCPRLANSKVRKIKAMLDYLLNETDYTREDIASVPRIFLFSLETIKKRIEELEMIGKLPKNLSKLTQGNIRFKKLVESNGIK